MNNLDSETAAASEFPGSMPQHVHRELPRDSIDLYRDQLWIAHGIPPAPRDCNRHMDCDQAEAAAAARGDPPPDHCHDEGCSDCFGN